MKLFRISSPGSHPKVVDLDSGEEPVTEIVIGESGRGRGEEIIPITGKGPDIRPRRVNDSIVFVRGDWRNDDNRCLVIINAVGAYDRYQSYRIFDASGIDIIASGLIAFGEAGGINRGEESLAIASPGAVFRLNSKYDSMWYLWNGTEWIAEAPAQRDARLALQEVEQGGGEWL